MIDETAAASARVPRLPSPLHLLAGVIRVGRALDWRDRRLCAAPWARPAWQRVVRPEATVRQWLDRHRRRRGCPDAVGAAGAGRAESPIDDASARPFVGRPAADVREIAARLRACPAGGAARRALRAPSSRLHRHAGWRTSHAHRMRARATVVDGAGRRWSARCDAHEIRQPGQSSAQCRGSPSRMCSAIHRPRSSSRAARGRRSPASPIVTVNLWFDGRSSTQRSSGCRAARSSGCSTSGRSWAMRSSHLSLVSSGAERVVAQRQRELVGLAHERARRRDARRARGAVLRRASSCASAARRSRWPRASRRGRRLARPSPGLFLAGDWIDTGLPATIESAVSAAIGRPTRPCALVD